MWRGTFPRPNMEVPRKGNYSYFDSANDAGDNTRNDTGYT